MCEVLNVSRNGYYAWCNRPPSLRTQENEKLSQDIQQIHQNSRRTYGSPRIHAALIAKGWQVGRQRVVHLMAKLGYRPYNLDDAQALLETYITQAQAKFVAQNYTVGEHDHHGQRFTIVIEIRGQKLLTGWILDNQGTLKCDRRSLMT
jgi:HTH-like domain